MFDGSDCDLQNILNNSSSKQQNDKETLNVWSDINMQEIVISFVSSCACDPSMFNSISFGIRRKSSESQCPINFACGRVWSCPLNKLRWSQWKCGGTFGCVETISTGKWIETKWKKNLTTLNSTQNQPCTNYQPNFRFIFVFYFHLFFSSHDSFSVFVFHFWILSKNFNHKLQ